MTKKKKDLTHTYDKGVHMVDISEKTPTYRTATARAILKVPPELSETLKAENYTVKKGSVMTISQIAGIMGAKKTSELIPLCHPLPLNKCTVELTHPTAEEIHIISKVSCNGKTGVEMEALTAVSIAALCFYDMCKSISHHIVIQETRLINKSGGKSNYEYEEN